MKPIRSSDYQMSGSESRPRKVELTYAFKKHADYCEYFYITMELVNMPTEASLIALTFIS